MGHKLFGTDGIRGIANSYPLNAEFMLKIAKLLAQTVCTEKKKVAIGKDTRNSGDMIEAALTAGFTACGIDVYSLGIVPTPLVTLKTKDLRVDMSIMITASHNPYQDNGIKLIDKNGDKFSDEFYEKIEKLLNKEVNENFIPTKTGKIIHKEEVVEEYIEYIRNIAPNYKAFQNLRIVLDCANGAYSYILPQAFKDLGAGVIAINNKPDGFNINKDCGTQHPEALAQTVLATHANFGIAVDGDGDRILLVDDKGQIIDGDQLLCFLAHFLKTNNLLNDNIVVATEWSNLGLAEYMKNNGFNYYKSKVGERYVIELMKEKKASLGGEVVGHIVVADFAKTGDALVCAFVLSMAYILDGRKMSDIFPIFTPYPCIIENIRFSTAEYMRESIEYPEVKEALIDGKKQLGVNSTLIARKSGTEPVIKLRVESPDERKVKQVAEMIKQLILNHQK